MGASLGLPIGLFLIIFFWNIKLYLSLGVLGLYFGRHQEFYKDLLGIEEKEVEGNSKDFS